MEEKLKENMMIKNKKNFIIIVLFIILLFFFAATLYLYYYISNVQPTLVESVVTTSQESKVYQSAKLGIQFLKVKDDYTISELDQTEFYEGLQPITTPTLLVENPRFTLRIVKYLDGTNFNDYFAQERIPNGGIYEYKDTYVKGDDRNIRKALSYSTDSKVTTDKDIPRTLLPHSLIYFTTDGSSNYQFDNQGGTNTDLFFTLNGIKYLVSAKLSAMINAEDVVNYTGKYDVTNYPKVMDDYILSKNLSEVETVIKSIDSIN